MSRRIYASIVLIFAVVFAMFLFVPVASDRVSGEIVNDRAGRAADAGELLLDSAFQGNAGNRRAAIVGCSADSRMEDILTEWCVYGKYSYMVYDALPDAAEVADCDVILFGDAPVTGDDLGALAAYARAGVPMVFTTLPDYDVLAEDAALADFFGIASCESPAFPIDGVKVFADFFLSGERIYEPGDDYGEDDDSAIPIPWYTLRAGYELYAVAVLSDQGGIENEQLPCLLWRTHTGNAPVFCVNADLFRGERLIGVVTALLSQAREVYLYPVVNAQAIALVNYPHFADENAAAMQARYSRGARGLSGDILWPNTVKVVKNYGAPFNFFLAPQLDFADGAEPSSEDVARYWKDINMLGGAVGLSLAQVSDAPLSEVIERDAAFLDSAAPGYVFTAAYAGDFSEAEIAGAGGILRDVSLVLTVFSEETRLIRALEGGALTVSFTQDGYVHEGDDDIQMLAFETALGVSAQKVDLARALYPSGDADDWSRLSRLWSEGNTFFNDFRAFDMVSVYELEDRARAFLALDFSYARAGDGLAVHIEGFRGEAYFVLRLHGEEVLSVTGGTFEQLTDTAYLIRAEAAELSIALRATDVASLPGVRP